MSQPLKWIAVNVCTETPLQTMSKFAGRQVWGFLGRSIEEILCGPISSTDLGVSSQNTEGGTVDRRGAGFPSNIK